MNTFIDNVLIRLKYLNKKPSHLIRDLSINKATFSMWKNKNRIPRADIAMKIARYLGTSVENLVCEKSPKSISSEFYLDKIKDCAEKMTVEKRNELANIAESLLECHYSTAVKIADLTEYFAKLERNSPDIVREAPTEEYLNTLQNVKPPSVEKTKYTPLLYLQPIQIGSLIH